MGDVIMAGTKHRARLKLVVPTDFEILETMQGGERETATHIAEILGQDSRYMNNRLSSLAGYGLVDKVGVSSMYVITHLGLAAIDLREDYDHSHTVEWGEKVRGRADLLAKSESLEEDNCDS